ncbi:MAG: hypothetical protein SGPRY_008242 [Prymnesium sp.]
MDGGLLPAAPSLTGGLSRSPALSKCDFRRERAVASAEQVLVIEAEIEEYSPIASPRLLPPRADSAHGEELKEEHAASYAVVPSFVADRDKVLASLVLLRIFSSHGKEALRAAHSGSGLRMLAALEERGKAARGSALKLLQLQRLEERQRHGVQQPVSFEAWHSYSSDLHTISEDAGGEDAEMMLAGLRAGIYGFPAELRSRALAASFLASMNEAIASFLENEMLARMPLSVLTLNMVHVSDRCRF